ncbi:hypothetical protein [Nocardioides marmorisolisilvae]|uniref:Uncharacterized protein n=1 Tax=Nocardioides marmorisolisilvae TaxID=1542737 RepID=A0A3N0DP70_9ACTN|nr:hypothetical protein [Nocardioides marmorisolisilvae]RNL77432.1 hypothetical protein EFL95_15470 [Nocardioides marmorisolisilvae]
MKKINKGRFATVVAGAAVLAVFGGGTAVAGSLITSAQIKDSTIVGADVKNSGLTGSDVKNSSLTGSDVKANSLTGYDIKNGSLNNADINVFNVSVESDGDVAYSSGGITVDHFTEGGYRIKFPRSVQSCSVVVSQASPTNYFPTYVNMGVADVLNQPNEVLVGVRNMNDNNDPQDAGFSAIAVC